MEVRDGTVDNGQLRAFSIMPGQKVAKDRIAGTRMYCSLRWIPIRLDFTRTTTRKPKGMIRSSSKNTTRI
jgi:hypothetical protein